MTKNVEQIKLNRHLKQWRKHKMIQIYTKMLMKKFTY